MSYAAIPSHVLEKRTDFRIRCTSPVQISARSQRQPMYGELRDVSTGGLRLRLNKRLKLGTEYRMYLAPEEGRDGVLVSSRPVWVRKEKDGTFEIGCRFKKAEGLKNYLRRAWAMDLSQTEQKRRTIRMDAAFDVALLDGADVSARALTRDLSFSGALLVTRTALRPETVLVARFDFGRRGVLRTPVGVAHCRALPDDPDGSFEVGVSFLALYGAQADLLSAVLGDLIKKR